MSKEEVYGVWSLRKLVDIQDGLEVERPYKIEGRLIYSSPNIMFVGFNYFKDSRFHSNFYTGEFTIEKGKMFHHVRLSSDESCYQTTLERSFRFLDQNTIILEGLNNAGVAARVVWDKLVVS